LLYIEGRPDATQAGPGLEVIPHPITVGAYGVNTTIGCTIKPFVCGLSRKKPKIG
jgi:hypothetical protein